MISYIYIAGTGQAVNEDCRPDIRLVETFWPSPLQLLNGFLTTLDSKKYTKAPQTVHIMCSR